MPKPAKYVSRSALGWPATKAAYANPRSGLVIHYDGSDQNLANRPHSACVDYWKRTRSFHMRTRGWVDIGYSFFACGHGYVLEGRGLYREQAAQPGGNSTWYSVTLATGPSEKPTKAQVNAVRQLRTWLMEPNTSIKAAITGHRDHSSTSCPGNILYRMVKDGSFKGSPEEDDMQLNDDVPIGPWISDAFPDSEGLQDGKIKVYTALGSGYGWSRIAAANTAEILKRMKAQEVVITKLAEALAGVGNFDPEEFIGAIRAELESIRWQIVTGEADA